MRPCHPDESRDLTNRPAEGPRIPVAAVVRIRPLLRLKALRKEIAMELQHYESLAQAAERTGISRKTLRRRIASGQLPVFSSGRRILRVRPEDVDAMLRPFWLDRGV